MKSRCLAACLSLVVGAGIALSGCAADVDPNTFRIGFIVPETGIGSADGRSALAGAQLAVDQANQDGGVDGKKVVLVSYDDASDPKQGAVIGTKLITQDQVQAAVSGSYSPQTLAAAAIFQRNQVPLMSAYAVNPGIPATGDYVFQQDFNGEVQGRAGAVQLAADGAERPAVIAINNDFGNALVAGFTDQAEASGMEVVSLDQNEFGETNFDTIIRRAVDADADAIYLVQYVAEGKQFFRSWEKAGLDLPVLSTEGIDSASFLDSIGDQADGVKITTNLNRDAEAPQTRAFLEDYAAEHDYSADMVAASSYDAVNLIIDAAESNGTDSEEIRDGLVATKDHRGATGTVAAFTDGRQVVKPVQVQQFVDGSLTSVGQIDDPEIITP